MVPRFSEEQKKIAYALFKGPKTVEELNNALKMPFDALNGNLKHFAKLKLVKAEGYPQKYVLADSVAASLRRRKEIQEKDPFDLRLKGVIEIKGIEERFVEKHLKEIEEKLRKEKNLIIYDIYVAPLIKEHGYYTSYLETNFSAKDFTTIVKFMYFFGPSSVEVIKPARIVLAMDDLQEALMEMAEMIMSYNQAMLKSMNKDELEAFAKNLYKPQKPENPA